MVRRESTPRTPSPAPAKGRRSSPAAEQVPARPVGKQLPPRLGGSGRTARREGRSGGHKGPEGRLPPRVDRELFRQPSGRRASAGRVLAVGLLCFGIWTLFDANQLYHNALTSPFGTRRSVAIAILRPLAAVSNAIKFSGPVNAADSALGRNGATTSPTLPPPPPLPLVGRAPNDADSAGVAPRPHGGGSYVPPAAAVWPPPLRQPTPARPLVMLDIGDSIGEDLGYGLGDVFSNDPYVRVVQKGRIDTGLARPDVYNWPVALEEDIKRYHPGAVVVMLGANDEQSLEYGNGKAVSLGTARWLAIYKHRVSLLMDEATASGAHVIWVGLPPMAAPGVDSSFVARLNVWFEQLAAAHSGVTFVPSWKTLAGPRGGFVQYKDVNGRVQQIRYSDGVHLAPTGWDLLASTLLGPMTKAWHIDLHATPLYKVG